MRDGRNEGRTEGRTEGRKSHDSHLKLLESSQFGLRCDFCRRAETRRRAAIVVYANWFLPLSFSGKDKLCFGDLAGEERLK